MVTEETTIQTLRHWSQILLWVSMVSTIIAALAVTARYVIDRQEKELSSRRTEIAIEKARHDASTARDELAELKKKNAPRELSAEQRTTMLRILRQTKGTVLIFYPADTEAQRFAKQLRAVIQEAGWTTAEEGTASFGPIIGLTLEAHDEYNTASYTRTLKEVLDTAFGNVLFQLNKNVDKGTLRLIVGSKLPE